MTIFRIALTVFLLILLLSPVCVHAEVMDKELSVPQIWLMLALALLICAAAAAVWRWLLIPSFFLGLLIGPAGARMEWLDPFVGPAIRHEAGAGYGIHATITILIIILAHIALWYLSSRFSYVARWRPPKHSLEKIKYPTMRYAISLNVIIVLVRSTGSGRAPIWLDLPLITTVIFGFWAIIADTRANKATVKKQKPKLLTQERSDKNVSNKTP
jgi:hypothetical protein